MDSLTLQAYRTKAQDFSAIYRSVQPTELYDKIKGFFHPGGVTADIGSGSGRDVAWLETEGFSATGYDASPEMLACARATFPAQTFVEDSLPELRSISNQSLMNVLCSATLMHLRREDLITAAINLSRILKPTGRLILSYRASRGSSEREDDNRLFTSIPTGKLVLLLESAGLRIITSGLQRDSGRSEVWWSVIVAEKGLLDRSRGLESIQSILVHDRKTATYKFALIRAFCQISRTKSHVVRWGSGVVYVPIDDVAVCWLTFYWPLMTAPTFIAQNQGEAPGCPKPVAFRSPIENLARKHGARGLWSVLRLGDNGDIEYRNCLRKIGHTIRVGPVRYSGTIQNPVFQFADQAPPDFSGLAGSRLGWIRVPESIWLDICRFDHWIEDSIIIRWAELSARMNPGMTMDQIIPHLVSKPCDERETLDIRSLMLKSDRPLQCVWSGKPLTNDIHVDHAIPFSVWGNNDYWNLLPCNDKLNSSKSDRLPTQALIGERSDCIVGYWRWYREQFSRRFDVQIANALGCQPGAPNWEIAALAGFRETVQRISITRGLDGWQP